MTTPRQPFKKLRRQKRPTDNLAAFRRSEKVSGVPAVKDAQDPEPWERPGGTPDDNPAARVTQTGDEQSEAHRARLLKALEATKARLTVAKPTAVYRIGEWFQVVGGEYAGCRGYVLELNFIDNQAYMQMTIVPEAVWIAFEDLSPDDSDDV